MANVTVRNLPADVVDALKAAAKANGRSMEGELRFRLTLWAAQHRPAPAADPEQVPQ
jgi:plasmid stability protein